LPIFEKPVNSIRGATMIARSFRLRSRKLAIAEADLRRDAIRGMSDMEWPLLAQAAGHTQTAPRPITNE
jgi:hypothetical protein